MADSASPPDAARLPSLTSQIVAAYVAHNTVAIQALPDLIAQVHQALARAAAPAASLVEILLPAVPVRRSVFPDHIVCLEDGRKLKTLKRHLRTAFGMTSQQYREKWGLPGDYPMVASAYASRRSELAKQIGLCRKRTAAVTKVKVSRLPARKAKGSRG